MDKIYYIVHMLVLDMSRKKVAVNKHNAVFPKYNGTPLEFPEFSKSDKIRVA